MASFQTILDGDLQGEIRIWDQKISEKTPAELAHTISYVYQDFENQLIRPQVLDDASYGLLNEGEEKNVMKSRWKFCGRWI